MNTNALLPHIRLQFHIDHPSYEEAYCFGYESALAEFEEQDNPFREGSQEAVQWMEGWWAGFYGEKPLFDAHSVDQPETYQDRMLLPKNQAANDQRYGRKHSILFLVFEISTAIAASAAVGYQLLELVA